MEMIIEQISTTVVSQAFVMLEQTLDKVWYQMATSGQLTNLVSLFDHYPGAEFIFPK
jgi:hypothetical protein